MYVLVKRSKYANVHICMYVYVPMHEHRSRKNCVIIIFYANSSKKFKKKKNSKKGRENKNNTGIPCGNIKFKSTYVCVYGKPHRILLLKIAQRGIELLLHIAKHRILIGKQIFFFFLNSYKHSCIDVYMDGRHIRFY